MNRHGNHADGRRDAVILGGGLIGLFTAYYLLREGRRVTIVERERLGGGAARGNGGQIVSVDCAPLPAPGMVGEGMKLLFSPTSAFFVKPSRLPGMAAFLVRFALNSRRSKFRSSLARMDVLNRRTVELYRELRQDGIGTGVHDEPFLYSYTTREQAEAGHAYAVELAARGLGPAPGALMDRDALVAHEPALGSEPQWGFVQAGELFAEPSALVDELIAKVRELGVEALEGESVRDIEETAVGVRITTSQRTLVAEQALVAAGAWSAPLLKQQGMRSIIKPGKGYSFTVDVERAPKSVTMFGDAHVGALPTGPGTVRIAGTMEFDGSTGGLDRRRIDAIVAAAAPHLAGADWAGIRDEWVGPRPMTPDGLPHIGLVPGRSRVFVCAGHNMLGLSLGPASAAAIADHMQGRPRADVVAAFRPGRFRLWGRK
ncbi:FAD-binding oxidoreductase [Leucobacter sp. CSA1]|uniref:FAD-binding oxidoreductase n=1 Tax=Leucobacter chromiisoli TaxID=2796471 RepID=A0A934QAE6_9MICO|nr:FAD-binding oxidoreductase [Leucobacter chromiisoli]MBK0419559.1 FAD-binding oxidoreductase [Leucobacter chromiisoli]